MRSRRPKNPANSLTWLAVPVFHPIFGRIDRPLTMGGRSVIPGTSLKARAMRPQKNDYGKWSVEELRRAESVADTFLQENDTRIRENFEAKLHALDELVTGLGRRRLTLNERLDCYARIAEVS